MTYAKMVAMYFVYKTIVFLAAVAAASWIFWKVGAKVNGEHAKSVHKNKR